MYFSKFPVLRYPVKSGDTFRLSLARNLLRRVGLSDGLKSVDAAFVKYDVLDGERPEHIADKLYGDPELHWLVLLANEIIDPYHDWYKSDAAMEEYLGRKYSGYHVYFTDPQDRLLESPQIDAGATLVQGSLSAPITSYDPNMCRVGVEVQGFSETHPTTIPIQSQVVEGSLAGPTTARRFPLYNPVGLGSILGLNGNTIPIKIHKVEPQSSSVRYFSTGSPLNSENSVVVLDALGQEGVTYTKSSSEGSLGLTQEGTGLRGVDVAGGLNKTFVLLNNGGIRTWGHDLAGGNPGVPWRSLETFSYPKTMKPVRAIRCGTGAIGAGVIHTDDTITLWGKDQDPYFPRTGVLDAPQGLTGVNNMVLGLYCGIVLFKDGRGLTAWGSSAYAVPYGLLNIPSTAQTAVQVSCNFSHAAALRSDGSVVCWGRNIMGECNVPAGLVATKVAAGIDRTYALRTDGTVVGWGRDVSGAATGYVNFPPLVASLNNNVVDIACDRSAQYFLRSDGKLVYWGGVQGVTPHIPTVVELGDPSRIAKLVAGGNHCVVLFTDGSVKCFGFNWTGEMNENLTGNVDLAETYIGRYMGITDYSNNTYAVSNRDHEMAENNKKRTIKLLHPRFKGLALEELDALLRV